MPHGPSLPRLPLLAIGLFVTVVSAGVSMRAGGQDGPRHQGTVDISTGLYIREDDDFVVDGNVVLPLRRTYLSGDRVSRHFGVGATHSGEWYLRGDPDNVTWAELVSARRERIRFERVTPGNGLEHALLRHTATSGEFYGAVLGWVNKEWAIRFADGRLARLGDCDPDGHDLCSLIEMWGTDNGSIIYARNEFGRLVAVQSDDDRIVLDYDDHGRIIRGFTTAGAVSYEYDDKGRLRRVTPPDNTVRSYTYDDLDQLTRIDEPDQSVETTFRDGRVVRKLTRMADGKTRALEFAYTIVAGRVAASDVTESDGTHTVYLFDEQRHLVSEVIDARAEHPISIDYDRGDEDSPATAITIQCTTSKGLLVRTVPAQRGTEDAVKESVIASDCRH